MRVIAGTLGGRTFDSPGTVKTHPMSDKARGALFNILGDVAGLTFLDAFAGSGALAFEAASRGAAQAVLLEQDTTAQKTIERNIAALGLERQVKLTKAAVGPWLETSVGTGDVYDVVMCDPPYDHLQQGLITRLATRVKAGGLLVLSWPGVATAPVYTDFEVVLQRSYGDMQLIFYRRI
jgi:16S rRNA (guanine966-N2)-methyltransferase